MIPRVLETGYDLAPNVKRLVDEISARPAAQAAEALGKRHAFSTTWDDSARRSMFPQNKVV